MAESVAIPPAQVGEADHVDQINRPTQADQTGHLDQAGQIDDKAQPDVVETKKKKNKKKKKSKSKKKAKPTGFEEFYADPPITPDEHDEESDLYSESRPFADRIQTCIQRYRARRKLDEVRANIFSKYLILGGIETTNKAFTGGMLDKETLENSTAREIAAIQASDFIRLGSKKYYDPTEADKWVVDWEGVAKGFFSHRVPEKLGDETESNIKLYSAVIRNFLNYVLQHRVCVEYTEDIMAARAICSLAERQLWAIKQIRSMLPGEFNIAASAISGGYYYGHHGSGNPWQESDTTTKGFGPAVRGFSEDEATCIFQASIAYAGTDELFLQSQAVDNDYRILNTSSRSYQIVEIQRPDLNDIEEWAKVTNHEGKEGFIKPLGHMKCETWTGPGWEYEDQSDDGLSQETDTVVDTFWLEDDILQLMFVGMKVELRVHELNLGIKFFDQVLGIYCSFYSFPENEKMMGWKDPVPNTRPAPTDDDPDAEERIMEGLVDDDVENAGTEIFKE